MAFLHGPRAGSHVTPPGSPAPSPRSSVPCLVTNTPLSAVHPQGAAASPKASGPVLPAHAVTYPWTLVGPRGPEATSRMHPIGKAGCMATRPSRLMTSRPSRLMTPRPSRLMCTRPSRPLGPGHPTIDHIAAPAPRHANCGRARLGHQSRRHTGYVAALCRDCRGCLRTLRLRPHYEHGPLLLGPAPRGLRHHPLEPAPHGLRHHKPLEAPNATSQRRWGGSTPNHPAALRSGMRKGFEPPEQQHTTYSPYKRERTQVRLASRVVHPGGFGTCVPGA
jgi:hypothetical protein